LSNFRLGAKNLDFLVLLIKIGPVTLVWVLKECSRDMVKFVEAKKNP
jgi:hypothetical protein